MHGTDVRLDLVLPQEERARNQIIKDLKVNGNWLYENWRVESQKTATFRTEV